MYARTLEQWLQIKSGNQRAKYSQLLRFLFSHFLFLSLCLSHFVYLTVVHVEIARITYNTCNYYHFVRFSISTTCGTGRTLAVAICTLICIKQCMLYVTLFVLSAVYAVCCILYTMYVMYALYAMHMYAKYAVCSCVQCCIQCILPSLCYVCFVCYISTVYALSSLLFILYVLSSVCFVIDML